jgi:hypothetical protein
MPFETARRYNSLPQIKRPTGDVNSFQGFAGHRFTAPAPLAAIGTETKEATL